MQAFSSSWNTSTPTGAPSADLEGTPRDTQTDMGAYEWVGKLTNLPIGEELRAVTKQVKKI